MTDLDKELKRIEQGDAWDESDEVVQVEVKKPLDKVIPIRLPALEWEKLREEAKALGVGPTTLARMWILERLRLQSISPQDFFKFSCLLGTSTYMKGLSYLLTPIEEDILKYIGQGFDYKEITKKLNLDEAAIKNHVQEILHKIHPEQGVITYAESKQKP